MNTEVASAIVERYANWIRKSMSVTMQGDAVQIMSPMIDRHNDNMSVFAFDSKDEPGRIILSDYGEVLADLAANGCDVLASPSRTEKLHRVIANYGVSIEGDELYVKTSMDRAAGDMNMLMQAMASVDDLFFTVNESVRGYFKEDVGKWLEENGIPHIADSKFTGKSGFTYNFDFAVPKIKTGNGKLIKTVNSPNRNSVSNALFWWEDVSQNRRDFDGYVFLNAPEDKGEVKPDLIDACNNYGITPVLFGINQDEFVKVLAA